MTQNLGEGNLSPAAREVGEREVGGGSSARAVEFASQFYEAAAHNGHAYHPFYLILF